MNLGRLRAVARKEFLHVFRDPRSLGMAIAIPLLQLVLFGFALTLDVDRVPLVVWDQSETPVSRDLVSRFTGSRYFALVRHVRNYEEIEGAIDRGEAMVALVVPRDFAALVAAGRTAPVEVLADGSDANTATIALGYADYVTSGFSQNLVFEEMARRGVHNIAPPLDNRPRVWFNADLQSKNYIVPGLIPVIMMVIAALLTSLTVAREWERGTMEQLISTPVTPRELVLGKLAPYFAIGMFDVLLAVLMGHYLFQIPMRGSLALVFGMGAVFLVGVLSLGLLISIVTRSQLVSSQLAMIATYLPAFLLSGFMIPIANMPHFIQGITYLVPARYFIFMLRGVYLKGAGLGMLAGQAALLAVFAGAALWLAVHRFRKKLA